MRGVGCPRAPRAVPAIIAIAIPKMRVFKCGGSQSRNENNEKFSFTKAGKTSQSSHPTFALWVPRITKRATTSAVQSVGRTVAAVYRNGGVTRREAMNSCDFDNLRQENQLGIGMRRSWHRGKKIVVIGIE